MDLLLLLPTNILYKINHPFFLLLKSEFLSSLLCSVTTSTTQHGLKKTNEGPIPRNWDSFCHFYCLQIKNTIRDGGSTTLEAAYTVVTVCTVVTVYTVYTVDTIEMVYNVDMEYTVVMVYTVHMVYTVDMVFTVDMFMLFT